MIIEANLKDYKELNEEIRSSNESEITINKCFGQRYIGDALSDKKITINGTPGNALGTYLNGADIIVNGNAQDAVGDTMNDGTITINGNSGDATGYAMRGGKIFVKGDIGYRAGIHMKAYKEKQPVLVVGGKAGSFLGEYQAGGTIIILGLDSNGAPPIANFCGTGMHGGRIFLRCTTAPNLHKQVIVKEAEKEDLDTIAPILNEFCEKFGYNCKDMLNSTYYLVTPDTKNPYKQMYVHN
ncbi:MAG: glutamate synthase [Clostridiales bacterium GWF2_38_85]|nr:MAG: glutamate synthase [Clostridiales bacterium GWF2_38_85]HBL84454.1 glutamate synthase [Clostridiales bacterium]